MFPFLEEPVRFGSLLASRGIPGKDPTKTIDQQIRTSDQLEHHVKGKFENKGGNFYKVPYLMARKIRHERQIQLLGQAP